MAKTMKPVRTDNELIELIETKGKGNNYAEKLHNILYTHFKEEDNLKKRVKELEKRKKQLLKEIEGLEQNRRFVGELFANMANLLQAISNGYAGRVDSVMDDLIRKVNMIKEGM